MQERSMTELLQLAMENPFAEPEKVKAKVMDISKRNKESLPSLPVNVHAPDANELEQIRGYMIQYKKENPAASKREIRRVAQQKFNVKIYRTPYKK